jgi:hypothetical protein
MSADRKLRVGGIIVQPVFMWDDGDELKVAAQGEPQQLPVSEVAAYVGQIKAQVGELEAKLLSAEAEQNGQVEAKPKPQTAKRR